MVPEAGKSTEHGSGRREWTLRTPVGRRLACSLLPSSAMRPSSPHFFPLAAPIILALFVALVLLIAFIEIGVIGYAYEKIGIGRRHAFTLLLLSLLGSYVNIPVGELPAEQVISGRTIDFFGMRYVVPTVEDWPRTIVAVNVGGAVIPVLVSLYLLARTGTFVRAGVATAIVAAVVHAVARPVPGIGIGVPTFVPPLAAAATALLLSSRSAPALAYVAGSLGTLIGADLMNLGQIRGLGAPIVSIGGAGTFDGIFVTGILAVLLA
jgi:uncharacterized membrane protein